MHDDEKALFELIAELETLVVASTANDKAQLPLHVIAPLPVADIKVLRDTPPAPTTVEPVQEQEQRPLSENPFVRNLLMMLPYDAQVLLGNVLSNPLLNWKLATCMCAVLLLVGWLTGYVAVPKSLVDTFKGFSCPVPAQVPMPMPATQ